MFKDFAIDNNHPDIFREILTDDPHTVVSEDFSAFLNNLSPESKAQLDILKLKQRKQNYLRDTYLNNPIKYIVEKLGHKPWGRQAEIVNEALTIIRTQEERRDYELGCLPKNRLEFYNPDDKKQKIINYLVLDAGHSVGKCVHFDDMIQLGNGYFVKASTLINNKFPLVSLQLDFPILTDGYATYNGEHECIEIKTSNGLQLRRTKNHPIFIKGRGWVKFENLSLGDKLCSPTYTPAFNGESLLDELTVKLLAYFSTCLVPVKEVDYNNYAEVKVGLKNYPFIIDIRNEEVLMDFFYALSSYDSTLSLQGLNDDGQYIISTHNPVNPESLFFSDWPKLFGAIHGVDFIDIYNLEISQNIFATTKYNVVEFIRCVFSCSGVISLDPEDGFYISIDHTSEKFIDGLNALMRRVGLFFTKRYDEVTKRHELYIDEFHSVVSSIAKFSLYNFFTYIFFDEEKSEKYRKDFSEVSSARMIEDEVIEINDIGVQKTVAIHVPETSTYVSMFYEHNTALLGYISNYFLDMYPSIVYAYAPTKDQALLLYFKEVKTQRLRGNLPGTILENGMVKISSDRFLVCKVTNDNSGAGTEKTQGQHAPYNLHVTDESENVQQYVFDAIESMISGGVSLVIVSRNPKTTSCPAHFIRYKPNAKTYEISCLEHPNVINGKELIPGAVTRSWIDAQLDKCSIVSEHKASENTFEVEWKPGVIYKPTNEFLWRVLGKVTDSSSGNKVMSIGTYESSVNRGLNYWFDPYSHEYLEEDFESIKLPYDTFDWEDIRIGVDIARFGSDSGRVWVRWGNVTWLHDSIYDGRTKDYVNSIGYAVEKLIRLIEFHVQLTGIQFNYSMVDISIRIDGGGGYAVGIEDSLVDEDDFKFDFPFVLYVVHNNAEANNKERYGNLVTEMYFSVAEETEKDLIILSPSQQLRRDLTLREFEEVVKLSDQEKVRIEIIVLESKKKFRKRYKESPDEGDGFVLACCSEELLDGYHSDPGDFDGLGKVEDYNPYWK